MNNNTTSAIAFHMPPQPQGGPIAILAVSLMGLFGNVLILLATWRSHASLNAKSNWLIAVLAVMDAISNLVTVEEAVLGYLGMFPMVQCTCYYAIVPVVFSINAGAAMIFIVGLDRLLALCVPVKYRHWPKRRYVIVMCLPAVLFGVANVVAGAACADCKALVFTCIPPTAMNGAASLFWVASNVLICVLVVGTYSAAVFRAYRIGFGGTGSSRTEQNKQRTLQSLCLIMVIFVCTWLLTVLANVVTSVVVVTNATMTNINIGVGLLAVINMSNSAYVYAARSTEYRVAFAKLLGCGKLVEGQGALTTKAAQSQTQQRQLTSTRL